MKCPNCDLITSRKNDYCPRCDADLIPHKKSLGIYDPNATPPPRQRKASPVPQAKAKKGFLAKILNKKARPALVGTAKNESKESALPRTQVVETNAVVEAISEQTQAIDSELQKQLEETNQIADEFAEFASAASNAPAYHEMQENGHNLDSDGSNDEEIEDDDDGEMLFTPDSGDDDEHQVSFTPEEVELSTLSEEASEQFSGDASGATQEIHATQDPELESLFAELNLDAQSEAMPEMADDALYEPATEDALPDILPAAVAEEEADTGLNEEEALKSLAQSLEMALGEAHVATEKLQTNEFENAQEFSLELPLEMLEANTQNHSEQVSGQDFGQVPEQVEDEPEEENEDRALLSGLMASLEELQAGTEEKSIVDKRDEDEEDSLFANVDKDSSTEDSLKDELSLLLGDEAATDVSSESSAASAPNPFEDPKPFEDPDPFEDSLAGLQDELDAELSGLAAEGTTFLAPDDAATATASENSASETPVDDPLAALQAELDSELSALAGEGTSFLGSEFNTMSADVEEQVLPAKTMEVELPAIVDPLAELEAELSEELEALAEIQEGGFFEAPQGEIAAEQDVAGEDSAAFDSSEINTNVIEDASRAGDPLADLEQELLQELDALAGIQEGGFFSGADESQPEEVSENSTEPKLLADLEAELSDELNALEAEQEGGFFSAAEELAVEELETNLEQDIARAVVEPDDSDMSFPDLSAVEEELEAELAAIVDSEADDVSGEEMQTREAAELASEPEELTADAQEPAPRLDVMETGVFLTSDLEKILADDSSQADVAQNSEVESPTEHEQEHEQEQGHNQPLSAATQTGAFLVEDLARIVDVAPDSETEVDSEEVSEPQQQETPQRLAATETGVFLASDFQRLIEEPDADDSDSEEVETSAESESEHEPNDLSSAAEVITPQTASETIAEESPDEETSEDLANTLSPEQDDLAEEAAETYLELTELESEEWIEAGAEDNSEPFPAFDSTEPEETTEDSDPVDDEDLLQEQIAAPDTVLGDDDVLDYSPDQTDDERTALEAADKDSAQMQASESQDIIEETGTDAAEDPSPTSAPMTEPLEEAVGRFDDNTPEPEEEAFTWGEEVSDYATAGEYEESPEAEQLEADKTDMASAIDFDESQSDPDSVENEHAAFFDSYEDAEDDEVTSTLVRAVDNSVFETPEDEQNDTAELAVVELTAALDDLEWKERIEDEEAPPSEMDSPIIILEREDEIRVASFGSRVLAFLADTLVVVTLGSIVTSFATAEAGLLEQLVSNDTFSVIDSLPALLDFMFYTLGVWVLLSFALVAWVGQTLGGKLAGVKVVQMDNSPPASLQAAVRACAQVLTLTTLGIGVLSFRRKEGRLLHDYIAETRVIKED